MKEQQKMPPPNKKKTREAYIKSFKKAAGDKSIEVFAEEGMDDYAGQLKKISLSYILLIAITLIPYVTFGQAMSTDSQIKQLKIEQLKIEAEYKTDSLKMILENKLSQAKIVCLDSTASLKLEASREFNQLKTASSKALLKIISEAESRKLNSQKTINRYEDKFREIEKKYNAKQEELSSLYKIKFDSMQTQCKSRLDGIESNGKLALEQIEQEYKNRMAELENK